jgi:hypothetical protein
LLALTGKIELRLTSGMAKVAVGTQQSSHQEPDHLPQIIFAAPARL